MGQTQLNHASIIRGYWIHRKRWTGQEGVNMVCERKRDKEMMTHGEYTQVKLCTQCSAYKDTMSWASYNNDGGVVNEYKHEGEITQPVMSVLHGPGQRLASCLLNGATHYEQLRIAQYYHCPTTWWITSMILSTQRSLSRANSCWVTLVRIIMETHGRYGCLCFTARDEICKSLH